MNILGTRRAASKGRRVAATLALTVGCLLTLGAGRVLAASPFAMDIVHASLDGTTVTIDGTADSPAGEQSGNYMSVDWGDGDVEVLPDFVGSGPWSWGPLSHTYAGDGTYTIVATLLHASLNGNDRSQATDSTEVSIDDDDVTPPEDDEGDVPDDDVTPPEDDDEVDVPDDDVTPSEDDDEVIVTTGSEDADDTEVLGERVTKQAPPRRLATTGSGEAATVLAAGLLLLMLGLHLRLRVQVRPTT